MACFDDPWTEPGLATSLAAPTTLGWWIAAPNQGEAAAYACFQVAADEAELLRIAVGPGHRRRGWAAALMAEAERHLSARGVRTCFLEVRADNLSAIALYRDQGFVDAGVRRRYYPGGVDARLFQRAIAPP